ncbi:MAG: PEP-CTERM sorting domain-containing protein [Acetobacteraceae bacterium]
MSLFQRVLPALLLAAVATPAHAGNVIFNTLHLPAVDANFVGTPQLLDCVPGKSCVTVAGGTWAEDPAHPGNPWNHGGNGAIAQSFHVAADTQITRLSFGLSAWDSGSREPIDVYLLKDVGGGAAQVVSPMALPFPVPNAAVSSLTGGVLIGSFSDASLVVDKRAPHLVTFDNLSVPVTAGTYWIGLVGDFGAYSLWWYNGDDAGTGTSGQQSFGFDPVDGIYRTYAARQGAYQMLVEVPEPTPLVVLGVGLIGLGLISRRKPAGQGADRAVVFRPRVIVRPATWLAEPKRVTRPRAGDTRAAAV